MTVILSTSGKSIGSEFSGISPNSRSNMGAGATVNAKSPTKIAPRFLPRRREIIGANKNASTAEITTLREMSPIC